MKLIRQINLGLESKRSNSSPCLGCNLKSQSKHNPPCDNCIKISNYQKTHPVIIRIGGQESETIEDNFVPRVYNHNVINKKKGPQPVKKLKIIQMLKENYSPIEISETLNCTLAYVYNVKNGKKHGSAKQQKTQSC